MRHVRNKCVGTEGPELQRSAQTYTVWGPQIRHGSINSHKKRVWEAGDVARLEPAKLAGSPVFHFYHHIDQTQKHTQH